MKIVGLIDALAETGMARHAISVASAFGDDYTLYLTQQGRELYKNIAKGTLNGIDPKLRGQYPELIEEAITSGVVVSMVSTPDEFVMNALDCDLIHMWVTNTTSSQYMDTVMRPTFPIYEKPVIFTLNNAVRVPPGRPKTTVVATSRVSAQDQLVPSVVIPMGVDPEEFACDRDYSTANTVGTHSMPPLDGVTLGWVTALKTLPYKLTWAGDGFLGSVVELESAGRVEFTGMLKREAVKGYLASIDVYWHASNSPGTHMALLEAMASGLPIVAYKTPYTAEILSGGAGILVDTPSEMKIAVDILMKDPGEREALGIKARAFATECCSYEMTQNAYRGLIGKLSERDHDVDTKNIS